MEDEGLLGALNAAAAGARHGQINPLANKGTAQVDLNDPAQLADLEDAGLMGHMEEARAQLAAQELAAAELPPAAQLLTQETEGRCALSEMVTVIWDQRAALAAARDAIFLHASNAERLAAGATPHGYPTETKVGAEKSETRKLVYLSSRINLVGSELERICETLGRAEGALTRARRSVEGVMVGRAARAAHYEGAWKELSTIIQKPDSA